ncbi:MAG: HNH endonuclease [Erysipelotrichia bacterium]|nr:HNH endonuclease [Erysipelotrichia bacterium]
MINVTTGITLKAQINDRGYAEIGIYDKNHKYMKTRIHVLVAKAFIPNPENLPQVDHINNERVDNRVQNLRWVTRSEN